MHVRTGIRRNFSCIAVNRTQEISALHSYQICDPADFNQRHSGRTTVITPLGEPGGAGRDTKSEGWSLTGASDCRDRFVDIV